MSITINWSAHIFDPEEVVILQRSDTRNGTYNPLVTLDGTTLSYVDTTTVDNKVYYYRVASTQENATVYSNILPLANFPNTGPGPSTLLRGDWEFGYFGEISNANFVTFAQIVTLTNPVLMSKQPEPSNWFKWIVNGKIIFFPNTPLANADAVEYASSNIGTAFVHPNVDPSTNPSLMSYNGNNLLVRLPYISNKFTTAVNPYGDIPPVDSSNFISTLDSTASISEVGAIGSMFREKFWYDQIDKFKYSDYTAFGTGVVTRRILTNNFMLDRNNANGIICSPHLVGSFYQPNAYPNVQGFSSFGIYYPILELQL